jgi:ADP-ribose pyrophosphatase
VKPDGARTVYEGKLVSVTLERWGEHEREIVEHPGAVVVAAVDRDGCIHLVRQLRESIRGELLELPAGTLKPGEPPLEAARRELAEETGLSGGEWREAAAFWTTPGFCRERMTLFFAEGVEAGQAGDCLRDRINPVPEAVSEDESFELVRWPVAEIGARLGEIEDAKTLAGLLLYIHEQV